MSALRVVHRVVLPQDGDLDVLPLYVDGEHVPASVPEGQEASVPVWAELARPATSQHPDQVLGRRSYQLHAGQRSSFATYFNAFPAGYWRRWSVVEEVTLRVHTSGPGTLLVYRSNAKGASARVATRVLDGAGEHELILPLAGFVDGGWYWFDLVAGQDDLRLESAEWLADDANRQVGKATIAITTFNRPAYCTALLDQLASAPELEQVAELVLVVDQGNQQVRSDPSFAAVQSKLGQRLRVVEQVNLGGSGGFARGMLETLDTGTSDYVLLLDDDVVCEPESIARAIAFADLTRRPTIIGGHMFSMYERSVLHAIGEIVKPWQFRWGPAEPTLHDHDLARSNLRSTPWLHRRTDVDYNGWWMCLIPTSVLRDVGLSLPVFIKWDDAEFGLRAAAAGHPTVSLPGVAVWHVPWTDKDDSIDWQAYFHARNRFVVALLHSPFEHGGRMVRESLAIQLKHVMALQYSAAALRQQALEDVLAGPGGLHHQLPRRLGELRVLRARYTDALVRRDPDDFPTLRPRRERGRAAVASVPKGRLGILTAAGLGLLHQVFPVRADTSNHPERVVAAADGGWWNLARLDSALVSTTDGTGQSWHQRDRLAAGRAMRDAFRVHHRLLREWPALARQYRGQLDELVNQDSWRKTVGRPAPADEDGSDEANGSDETG
jgi:galactofuranosylgalactofuranosylrhamnosyl-N-acetylglucosaminyl-diphospho-decaprenol beta-1,5/1,6-galactofuranosyltransferase